jgi:hypothetical protein
MINVLDVFFAEMLVLTMPSVLKPLSPNPEERMFLTLTPSYVDSAVHVLMPVVPEPFISSLQGKKKLIVK